MPKHLNGPMEIKQGPDGALENEEKSKKANDY
jgi:hypothetical protein